MTRRIPHTEESERAVLGAMLVDPSTLPVVMRVVSADAFYRLGHRHLFAALAALAARGETPEPATVLAQLERDGTLAATGGAAYVHHLADSVATTANVGWHAREVATYAARRTLLALGQALALDATEPGADPVALAGRVMADLVPVATQAGRGQGFVRVADDAEGLIAEITAPPPPDGLVGVPTGWPALDVMTKGYLGGELVIFAAVPGGCKTVALINVATFNAIKRAVPVPVGFVSAEMTRRALHKRMLCDLAEIDTVTMRGRTFTDLQGHRLRGAVRRLTAAPLWIDETPTPDLPTMFAKCRALKAEVPEMGLLCVDYAQLIRADTEENRAEQIRAVMYGLKGLAKELNVPVFTAAQVNDKDSDKRGGKDGGSKRPRLDDLQGSSGIRQAGDAIALLHRPSVYGESTGDDDTLEMYLAKNRELPPTTVLLEAELKYQRLVPARYLVGPGEDINRRAG